MQARIAEPLPTPGTVVLDNRGYGCIQRLQLASGSPRFNNMLSDCVPEGGCDLPIDFAGHARALVTARDPLDLGQRQTKGRRNLCQGCARQPAPNCLQFAKDLHQCVSVATMARQYHRGVRLRRRSRGKG